MDSVISAKGLSCGYRSGFRIEGVTFELQKGSFTGILGPNGTGKSTLFKGISGDLPIREGEVRLLGRPLGAYPAKQLSQTMAVVSQFTEESAVTAEEYVMMGRLPYRRPLQFFDTDQDRDIVRRYMELTGTFALKDRMMPELSGGEQQMVAIASALAQEPELILLDEPTSHLDLTHQVRFLDLLKSLNRQRGLSVILILHDLNLAASYCDYLLMLRKGGIACQGTPEEVLTERQIEAVYETPVWIRKDPFSGKPMVFPLSGEAAAKRGSRV